MNTALHVISMGVRDIEVHKKVRLLCTNQQLQCNVSQLATSLLIYQQTCSQCLSTCISSPCQFSLFKPMLFLHCALCLFSGPRVFHVFCVASSCCLLFHRLHFAIVKINHCKSLLFNDFELTNTNTGHGLNSPLWSPFITLSN